MKHEGKKAKKASKDLLKFNVKKGEWYHKNKPCKYKKN
jgi:hypothetical protein